MFPCVITVHIAARRLVSGTGGSRAAGVSRVQPGAIAVLTVSNFPGDFAQMFSFRDFPGGRHGRVFYDTTVLQGHMFSPFGTCRVMSN